MSTSLHFLGTAGDATVVSTLLRNAGGIVLKTAKCQLHIDPGPGAIVNTKLQNIKVHEHTGIILSSDDILASDGTIGLLYAMSCGGVEKRGVLVHPDHFTLNGAEQYAEKILQIQSGKRFTLRDIEVVALQTSHEALGYMFFTPQTVITYTGMTSAKKNVVQQYEKSDILILSLSSTERMEHRISTHDVTGILSAVKPQLCILTSFGAHVLKQDVRQLSRDIYLQTGVRTIAATDGLVILPETYAAHSKQKRLL